MKDALGLLTATNKENMLVQESEGELITSNGMVIHAIWPFDRGRYPLTFNLLSPSEYFYEN